MATSVHLCKAITREGDRHNISRVSCCFKKKITVQTWWIQTDMMDGQTDRQITDSVHHGLSSHAIGLL